MKIIRILILILCYSYVNAQTARFANEWINFDQPYFKFAVAENGVYQIDFQTLKKAGVAAENIAGANFSIYHHGREIAVWRSREDKFSTNDYLEFYAQKRDGTTDSLLYESPDAMPHPYFSLFSDTTYYYLTYSNRAGIKIPIENRAKPANSTPESYHLATDRYVYTDEYSFNTFTGPVPLYQLSTYDKGEAMTGRRREKDQRYQQQFELTNYVAIPNEPTELRLIFNGRSSINKDIAVEIQDQTDTIQLQGYEYSVLKKNVAITTPNIQLATKAISNSLQDFYSLSLAEITYPQRFIYQGKVKSFNLKPTSSGLSSLAIQTNQQYPQSWLYDISNPEKPIKIVTKNTNTTIEATVPNTQQSRNLLLGHQVKLINNLEPVTFRKITATAHNYIIVTHPRLWSSATDYEAYRKSKDGGSFNTLLLNIKDVYDQFNYGEHSPMAIRRMAHFLLQDTNKEKYLLLLGKAHSLYDARPQLSLLDLVPSIGYPASDNLLTSGLENKADHVPTFMTGRVPATTNEQVINLLEKIKVYEKTPFEAWRKNVVQLSGGSDIQQIGYLKSIMTTLGDSTTRSFVGASVRGLSKQTTNYVENAPITPWVNEGVGMIGFLGHSSPISTDLNIGNVTDPARGYTNNGKYPFLYFNGCSYVNCFRALQPQASDWLFAAQKGAVGVIGQSYVNDLGAIEKFMNIFYGLQFHNPSFFYQPIGKILQESAQQMMASGASFTDIINVQEMVLLGDPSMRYFPIEKPDYHIQNVFIESVSNTQSLAKSAFWRVGVVLKNIGKNDKDSNKSISLSIESKSIDLFIVKPFANSDTIYFTIKNEGNINELKLTIDNKNEVAEINETNNTAILKIDNQLIANAIVFPANNLPDKVSPILDITINGQAAQSPIVVTKGAVFGFQLTDNRPLITASDTAKIYVSLVKKCNNCAAQKQSLQLQAVTKNNILEWLSLLNLDNGDYEMTVQATDLSKNTAFRQPIIIAFSVIDASPEPMITVYPNPFNQYVIFSISNPSSDINQAMIEVYDLSGKLVDSLNAALIYPINQVYWVPPKTPQKLYYRLTLGGKTKRVFSGKLQGL